MVRASESAAPLPVLDSAELRWSRAALGLTMVLPVKVLEGFQVAKLDHDLRAAPRRRPSRLWMTRKSSVPPSLMRLSSPNSFFKAGVRRSFNSTTVWEQHPRSQHKGATCMQTHAAVRVGWRPSESDRRNPVLSTRHPYHNCPRYCRTCSPVWALLAYRI